MAANARGTSTEQAVSLIESGHPYVLEDGAVIVAGRASSCEMVLDSRHVSRMHARFTLQNGVAVVEDLESRNGVFVDGQKIARAVPLSVGANVLIGDRMVSVRRANREDLETMPRVIGERYDTGEVTAVGGRTRHELLLAAAKQFVRQGRTQDACEGMRLLFDGVRDASELDAAFVVAVTGELVVLAQAAGDAKWLDRLLRMRQESANALDAATTEAIARAYSTLPAASRAGRGAYAVWAGGRPCSFSERLALKKLLES